MLENFIFMKQINNFNISTILFSILLIISCSKDKSCPEIVMGYSSSNIGGTSSFYIDYGPRDQSSSQMIKVNSTTYEYYKNKLENSQSSNLTVCWEGMK
jgi:hypothetical protein